MAWWAVVGVVLAATTPPTVPPPATPVAPPATSTVPPASVPIAIDPLACDVLVHDPRGELDAEEVAAAATLTAATLGADLRVRAERDLDGGLDARMAQLETQCPTWWSGSDRAPDLVVLMYSSTARQASVFYGPGQSFQLEHRWESAVDAMGAEFAAGDFTGGVLAGLAGLREDPPSSYAPTLSPTLYADDDSGSGSPGVPAVMWLGLVALVIVAVVRVGRFLQTGEWDTGGDDDDDTGSSSWSSASSRRSSGGSWRRSSSASRSSGSRSSGRSGGGTKTW